MKATFARQTDGARLAGSLVSVCLSVNRQDACGGWYMYASQSMEESVSVPHLPAEKEKMKLPAARCDYKQTGELSDGAPAIV